MKIETIAIHAGNHINADKAVIQPITLSTTFERGEDGGYPGGYIYSRAGNPNRNSLENLLARLENGEDACAFSSGNAAGSAVFQSLEHGCHIIAPNDMYHGLSNLLNVVFDGILEVSYVAMHNLEEVEKAIRPETCLIWIETPSNPLLGISDISSLVNLAKKKNIKVVCDNTFATPVYQQPHALGVDIVMHATTKYLSGHSDVLGGALITRTKDLFWEKVRSVQELSGAVPSPFDCYMTVRGIKTLPYRMQGHAANAMKLAEYLESHPFVEHVHYPGLESHPQHLTAKKQMTGYSGMLSFLVKGGAAEALKLVNSTRLFTQATSLGGIESLIEHRASIEGPQTKTPQNLVRVSVGLEHIQDLLEDLSAAINAAS